MQSSETCVLVKNNLCEKLFSLLESPSAFDGSFKVTSVSFLTPDFHLLSCQLTIWQLKCYIESFFIEMKWNYNTLTVPYKKS